MAHRRLWATMILALGLLAAHVGAAASLSPEQEERYYELLKELRCLVCQNESLYESRAELAQDLRDEVQKMLANGDTDDEIMDFMLARYGEFVLYKPRFIPSTLMLWLGPWLVLIGGFYFGYRVWKRQSREPGNDALSHEQRQQLSRLMDGEENR